MRLRLFGLFAAVLIAPALAQIAPIFEVTPSLDTPIHSTRVMPNSAKKAMTIEEAEARIAKLNLENRELTQKLNETLTTLSQWTKKGGALVHAYCASNSVSQRTDGGGVEDCSASGYACSPVEGICRRSCNVTDDCAGHHVCDTAAHVCVRS